MTAYALECISCAAFLAVGALWHGLTYTPPRYNQRKADLR